MKTRRIMMAVAMMLVCMNSIAQKQRMKEFQELLSKYETSYRDLIKSGKYEETIAPLKTLINILDTTTIMHRLAAQSGKADPPEDHRVPGQDSRRAHNQARH